eukprot:1057817-Amphidinium_carterae.1
MQFATVCSELQCYWLQVKVKVKGCLYTCGCIFGGLQHSDKEVKSDFKIISDLFLCCADLQ